MDNLEFSVYVPFQDYAKMTEVIISGRKSDIMMDIDIIEDPLHLEYTKEDDVEYLVFYQRGLDGEYEEPRFSFEVKSLDDFDQLKDPLREAVLHYYAFAHNVNVALTEEKTIERIRDEIEFQIMGGFYVTYPERGHIKADPVYGTNRPDLLCYNEKGKKVYARPYIDEMIDEYEQDDEDLSVADKIERVLSGELESECDEMFDAFIGISSSPRYGLAMHLAKELMLQGDDAGYFMAAILYSKGLGVKKDIKQAINLIEPIKNHDALLHELHQILSELQLCIPKTQMTNEELNNYVDALLWFESFLNRHLKVFDGKAAKKYARKLIQNQDMKGYYYLGSAFMEEKRYNQAVNAFKKGIEGKNDYCLIGLGRIYLEDDRAKEGVALLKQAAKHGLHIAYGFLAEYYLREGNLEQSEKYFEKYYSYEKKK